MKVLADFGRESENTLVRNINFEKLIGLSKQKSFLSLICDDCPRISGRFQFPKYCFIILSTMRNSDELIMIRSKCASMRPPIQQKFVYKIQKLIMNFIDPFDIEFI